MVIQTNLNVFGYSPEQGMEAPNYNTEFQSLSVIKIPITGIANNDHIAICEIDNEKCFSDFSYLANANNAALKVRIVIISKKKYIAGDTVKETDISGEISFASTTSEWASAYITEKARRFHLARISEMRGEIIAPVSGKGFVGRSDATYVIAAKITVVPTVADVYLSFKGTMIDKALFKHDK